MYGALRFCVPIWTIRSYFRAASTAWRPSQQLWLGGFSFGAFVALSIAAEVAPARLLTVAPPLNRFDMSSLTLPRCPWLIIQGDEDELVNVSFVSNWVSSLKPPPELMVMEGADHFFHRRIMDLRGLLKNGVREHLPLRPDETDD